MKKSLIAMAVLAAAGAASAQSSVTLYGRLDAGLGRQTTETTGAAPVQSLTQTLVTSSALNTTFWGIKGTEDLGGGLKANFQLESGFAVDTGAAAATLFEREAHVGLAGGFGSVDFGRQYSAYDALFGATNNIANTNVASTGTVWATGVAAYATRLNNSISYQSPTVGGFSGKFVLGLGENAVNATVTTAAANAAQNVSLNLMYGAGPLVVGLAYQKDQAQLIGVLPAASSFNDTTNTLLAASYDLGVAKLTGGYNKASNKTRNDNEYQLGVNVPMGATTLFAGYSKSASSGANLADLNSHGFTLAGAYSLSKRTTLYAGYLSTSVEGSAVAVLPANISTVKTTTFATGVRHTF